MAIGFEKCLYHDCPQPCKLCAAECLEARDRDRLRAVSYEEWLERYGKPASSNSLLPASVVHLSRYSRWREVMGMEEIENRFYRHYSDPKSAGKSMQDWRTA